MPLNTELEQYIEQTLLKPDATKEQVKTFLQEAKEYSFAGVCINPFHVSLAKKILNDSKINIVTVVGFPLGANKTEVKVFETQQAIKDGADEIDMVINIGAVKAGCFDLVKEDVAAVVKAAGEKPVKVILETDLLTKEEIAKASKLCAEAGAKFVKTSTGFVKNGVGAKAEDVKLMYDIVSPYGLQVKASGGIKTREDAVKMINAGAVRIGTSSGIEIIKGS